MIRLAPLITADVDTTTLPGGKASDAAQDFLALLSEALAGETTTDKAAPQLLVATDKPTTKGEPLAKLSVCKWGCHLRHLSILAAISICPF